MLKRICGIQKNGKDDFIHKAELEIQAQRIQTYGWQGGRKELWEELEDWS